MIIIVIVVVVVVIKISNLKPHMKGLSLFKSLNDNVQNITERSFINKIKIKNAS